MGQTNSKKMHHNILKTKTLWLIAASNMSTIYNINAIIQTTRDGLKDGLNCENSSGFLVNIDDPLSETPLFAITD